MRVTSNRSVAEWGGVFGNPLVLTFILDGPLHHSRFIMIRGDNWGLGAKRRKAESTE